MLRASKALAAVALVIMLVCAYIAQALHTNIRPFDEPLWFMRSHVTPANLSTPRYRYWAVDIPGVNRWAYYAVLKATGLDKVPEGEKPCWSMGKDGYFRFNLYPTGAKWKVHRRSLMLDWENEHGRFAPYAAIMAMRVTNVGVFIACLACMWWTAWMILRSTGLAALSVAPLVLSPVFCEDTSYVIGSGDVFLAAALAATLAAWTYFHLRGAGTSRRAIIAVAALAGLATASKHTGILAVLAFATYLAWQSRGRQRLVNPAVACLIAFGVFAAINPAVFFYPGERPWNVLLMMIERRGEVIVRHVGKRPFGPLEAFRFFWWPLVPLSSYCLWVARRQRWFPAVGLWAAFLIAGVVLGLTGIRVATERYLAPLEMGVYFPVSLVLLWAAQRHERLLRDGGGKDADERRVE